MRLNLKLILASLVLPVGFASVLTTSSPAVSASNSPTEISRPYVVVTFDASGTEVNEITGVSGGNTAFDVSQDLGANPFVEDRFKEFPDIKMGIGSRISLYRAPEITIYDGKKKIPVRSWAKTVSDLFDEQQIELLPNDKTDIPLATELSSGMSVKITRVAITQAKKTLSIDFKIIQKNDNTLDKGKTRIDQAGAKGEKVLTYEVRREDGVEVSRKLIDTTVTKQPVDQILIIGTKPVITGWCKYNDWVLDASIKNGVDPDRICNLMKVESYGHADSVNPDGPYSGLFQYTDGLWATVSAKAGYTGASVLDPKAQIYVTAWAVTHGYSGRWPGTWK
ncbi:MAG: G5 domain-containing protein [Candidatus Berkelbacteria bacterium]|nr:G5 domain-containing protein [Candidatus Berkelbacteria bacterium]